MRKDITVAAQSRDSRGKNAARRLRAAGSIPAVLYGSGGDALPVTVSPKEIQKILRSSTGHNTIFDLDVAGKEKAPVMVVDELYHPVSSRLLHIDLKRIDLTKRLHVRVPVHTSGEPYGVKIEGGMFEVITREIEIECLPDDIPEEFAIDVVYLKLNQALRASEVPLSGSMKLLSPADQVVAHVVSIRAEETPAAEAGAEAKAEPEVVKKGKKEEEAAAGDDKAKKK